MNKIYSFALTLAMILMASSVEAQTLKPYHHRQTEGFGLFSGITANPAGRLKQSVKAPQSERAQGNRTLSYCNSEYDNTVGLGDVSKGDSLSACILFTKEQLAEYKGGKIIKIKVPVNSKKGLYRTYGWVAVDDYKTPVAIKKINNFKVGYNEYTLEEPIEIDGKHDIYFGSSYVLKATAKSEETYCIPTNSSIEEVAGGLIIGCGSKTSSSLSWSDESQSGSLGNFAVEAVVSGIEMNAVDVKVLSATTTATKVKTTDEIPVTLTLKNVGAYDITSYDIEAYLDGTLMSTTKVSLKSAIATDQTATSDATIQLAFDETHENAVVEVKVTNVNGNGDDEDMSNNTASFSISAYEKMYHHTVLFEEGTGQWCGWCIRGYVGLEEMHEKNYDDFIGMGVHVGYYTTSSVDTMAFAIDSKGNFYGSVVGYTGYPQAVVDKQYSCDPSEAQEYYEYLSAIDAVAGIYGRAYWDGDNIVVSGDVQFCYNAPAGSNFRIVTYLIEDEVGPYYQQNYYSGGNYGTMGGYEKAGSVVPLIFNDVLRGVYPDIPSDFTLGEELTEAKERGIWPSKVFQYEYTYEVTPKVNRIAIKNNSGYFVSDDRYQNKENLRLAVALLDYDNGGIVVNACKVPIASDKESAISGVETNNNAPAEYYSLDGIRLDGPAQKGIYIVKQGSKTYKRLAQ